VSEWNSLTKIWANQEHKPRRAAASNDCWAPVSLARVGLVLSFDASRLARNHRDRYHLLEVCSIFGTLIADGERLYDPRLYHDRRLVGLSGMMSEAELHYLKQRLHTGARHKAERGELRQGVPVG
jgi:DNA invertase Pin-like site-specific DNA recombinase